MKGKVVANEKKRDVIEDDINVLNATANRKKKNLVLTSIFINDRLIFQTV